MSDEFIEVATREIKEEIDKIHKILLKCSNDSDLSPRSDSIRQHLHKIKGLAPMMGKEEIGNVASLGHDLLTRVIKGNLLNGTYRIICDSNAFMKQSLEGLTIDEKTQAKKLKEYYSQIIN